MFAQLHPAYVRRRPLRAVTRVLSMGLFEGRALLQRGRWINPIVLSHMAIEKRLPQLVRVEKPIYIFGTGRSGTTILGLVLSFHPRVGFLNEPKGMWYSACPDEDLIGSYTLRPAKYRMGEEDATEDVSRNIRRLYGAYLRLTGASRVLDKSDWAFRIPFLRAIFPGSRFLVTVRNGWDTCRSIETWSATYGDSSNGEITDWWGRNDRRWNYLVEQILMDDPYFARVMERVRSLSSQTDRAVVEWIAVMRECIRAKEQWPDAVRFVHYETLCESPRTELAALLDFCELPPDPELLEFGEDALRPSPPREPFEIDLLLRPLFDETMSSLGY